MSYINPLNVSVQSWWSKNKVVLSGILVSIFTAISPLFVGRSHEWDIKAIIAGACVAGSAFLARELRGKNWTIAGQVLAGIGVYASVYDGDFDFFRLLACLAVAVLTIPLSPTKLSTYEHAPNIVQAKQQAEQIKEIRKANYEKSSGRDTK